MASDKNMDRFFRYSDSGSCQRENSDGILPKLSQVPISVTLSAEQFEKLFLSPMIHRQSSITKSFGNPTPLALGAFVLTAAPLACCLMGWRGASGGGAAFTGVLILFGGLLLVISSILEFVIGNTFPSVVFGHFGGFCLALGATFTPAFNSTAPYSETMVDTVAGLHSPGFLNTFAFFFLFMALLIYLVCALRTNAIFVSIFVFLVPCFSLLAGSYWRMARSDIVLGARLSVAAGALLFVVTVLGFYLLAAQIFESVGLPWSLPIGDLSRFWGRKKEFKSAWSMDKTGTCTF